MFTRFRRAGAERGAAAVGHAVRRLHDEGGAIVVVVAVMMVALLGFAALGLDSAALNAEKRLVQNGADAAALAVAQTCASGDCDASAAEDLVARNDGRRPTRAAVDEVAYPAQSTVRVRVASEVDTRFAGALDAHHADTTVAADAAAAWGAPTAGTARLPFAVSWCEFEAQTGGGVPSDDDERTLAYRDPGDSGVATGCQGPSGLAIPGGFGWLATDDDGEACRASSRIDEQTPLKPGNAVPRGCSPEDFHALQGETLLLPVYTEHGGEGDHAWVTVHGYAAFTLTGYRLSGSPHYSWNSPCRSVQRCLTGYFTRFVTGGDVEVGDAPELGATAVTLIPNEAQ